MARINVPVVQGLLDLDIQGRSLRRNDHQWIGQVNPADPTDTVGAISYGEGDIVAHNGSLWLSTTTPNENNLPVDGSTFWTSLGNVQGITTVVGGETFITGLRIGEITRDLGLESLNDVADINAGQAEVAAPFTNAVTNLPYTEVLSFLDQSNTTVVSIPRTSVLGAAILSQLSVGDNITLFATMPDGTPINDAAGEQIIHTTTIRSLNNALLFRFIFLTDPAPAPTDCCTDPFVVTSRFTIGSITPATDDPGPGANNFALTWIEAEKAWRPRVVSGAAWSPGASYPVGALVTFQGVAYQSIAVSGTSNGLNPLVAPAGEWTGAIISIDDITDVNVGTAAFNRFESYVAADGTVLNQTDFTIVANDTNTLESTVTLAAGGRRNPATFWPAMAGDVIRLTNITDPTDVIMMAIVESTVNGVNQDISVASSGRTINRLERFFVEVERTVAATAAPSLAEDGYALSWDNASQTWQPARVIQGHDYLAALPTTGLTAGLHIRLQGDNRVYTYNGDKPGGVDGVWIADGPEVIFIKGAATPVTVLDPRSSAITWAEVPQYIYGAV